MFQKYLWLHVIPSDPNIPVIHRKRSMYGRVEAEFHPLADSLLIEIGHHAGDALHNEQ